MGVEGDETAEFISQQLRMRDSSGYGGGKYASANVINVEPSENGDGWARFTIEYTKGYDV